MAQKYRNSRNASQLFSFEEALLKGYAPGGGLFLPSSIPRLTKATLAEWSSMNYVGVVIEICKLFISEEELPHKDLKDLIQRSFVSFKPGVVHVKHLRECAVLELFHGPTQAFKDLAMSCTMNFCDYFLAKRKRPLNIIVSTSGDTGAAAMHAAKGSKHVNLTVLYPYGRVSEIQELQMTTAAGGADNLHLFAIDGSSDDGDDVMRELFSDVEFVERVNLSNVNSVNWSRIMIQIAHWVYGYLQLRGDSFAELEVVCPTGAGGNLTAGYIAREMGLPIKIVVCINENDCFHQFIQTGTFKASTGQQTLANAMDIQVPYNLERLVYLISGGDLGVVRRFGEALDHRGQAALPNTWSDHLTSVKIDDETILKTIKECFEKDQYLMCPHSATAMAYQLQNPGTMRLLLATASSVKFPEALERAGLSDPEMDRQLADLRTSEQKVTRLKAGDNWTVAVKEHILRTVA